MMKSPLRKKLTYCGLGLLCKSYYHSTIYNRENYIKNLILGGVIPYVALFHKLASWLELDENLYILILCVRHYENPGPCYFFHIQLNYLRNLDLDQFSIDLGQTIDKDLKARNFNLYLKKIKYYKHNYMEDLYMKDLTTTSTYIIANTNFVFLFLHKKMMSNLHS